MTKQNTVTAEQIKEIVDRTEFETLTVHGKTTIVSAKLPNGFVIVESSSCVDPANYDETVGVNNCKARIINKIWELEGYRLQDKVYRDAKRKDIRKYTLFELIDLGFVIQMRTDVNNKTTVMIERGV